MKSHVIYENHLREKSQLEMMSETRFPERGINRLKRIMEDSEVIHEKKRCQVIC